MACFVPSPLRTDYSSEVLNIYAIPYVDLNLKVDQT
jgi:hypothetical protein